MTDVPALVLARVADDLAVGCEVRMRMEARLAAALKREVEQLRGTMLEAPVAGSLAAFHQHSDALACAVQLRSDRDLAPLRPRIAIHAGELEQRVLPGGTQWTDGPAVHQVARIAAVARSGQVVSSEWVAGAVPSGWSRDDTGHHELVGVMGQVRLDRLRAPGEAPDWMPPVRSQGVVGGNVLPQVTSLVGREEDLSAVTELLELGVRVTTVVGQSGIGGARLCREVALVSRGRSGGVWWCDARNGSLVQVIRAVGEALGLPLVLGRTLSDGMLQVGHALSARGVGLLVVDGVDVLAGDTARVIAAWSQAAPKCQFLVHAPEGLGVAGEVVYRLHALPEPQSVHLLQQEVARYDAQPIDVSLARGLVRALDRNSFALGLVAALVDKVPPAELVVRLRTMSGGPLRVLGLVWMQLSGLARNVLEVCAVFPATFDLPGVIALLGDGAGHSGEASVLDGLLELEHAGLVRTQYEARAAGVRLLGLDRRVRQFVLGRIGRSVRRGLYSRFAEYVLAGGEAWSDRAWDRDGAEVLARLDLERENLLAVARWGLSDPARDVEALRLALRATVALQPLFLTRGPFPQQRALLDEILEQCADHPELETALQVRLLLARVDSRRLRGRHARARTDLARATALAERSEDPASRSRCLYARGTLAYESGDAASATGTLQRGERLARELGLERDAAMALSSLGVVHLLEGRAGDAEESLRSALTTFRELGSLYYQGIAVGNLGSVLRALRRYDEARDAFRTAIALHRDTGERRLEAVRVANLAALEMQVGQLEDARAAWDESVVLAREVGDRDAEASGLEALGLIALERQELQTARARLSESLALHRLARDTAGEGTALGYLGLVDHRCGILDGAREAYGAALGLLREAEDGARLGMFTAWMAALDAEEGAVLGARGAMDGAHRTLRDVAPEHMALLDVLEATLDLLMSRRDPSGGGVYLEAALARVARAPLDQGVGVRLAVAHVSALLKQAAVDGAE